MSSRLNMRTDADIEADIETIQLHTRREFANGSRTMAVKYALRKVAQELRGEERMKSNQSELIEKWRELNNGGLGYEVGGEEDDINELAGVDGLTTLVLLAQSDDEIALYRDTRGHLIGVGDANGPWAIDLTEWA